MQKNPYIIGTVILLGISLLSGYLLAYEEDPPERRNHQNNVDIGLASPQTNGALANVPVILPVPERLEFASEEVPLHRPDIRERFEKELYITAHRYYQVVFYLKRAPRILPTLARELKEGGIPEDFKYMAVIESDLLPTIESPVGAKGIWQFMPATARKYGLEVNRYVDERMNLEKATQAAIEFLKNSYQQLDSWTLAAASYNMGLARTKKTVKQQQTRDYYNLYMNSETSRFVFRILAAKVIIGNPGAYGYSMPDHEVYKSTPYREIKVKRGITDLVEWSKSQGFSYYKLKKLNPWILRKKLPVGSYKVRIPKSEKLNNNIDLSL